MANIKQRLALLEERLTASLSCGLVVLHGRDFETARLDWETANQRPLTESNHIIFFEQINPVERTQNDRD